MRVRVRTDFRELVTDGRQHLGIIAGAEYVVIQISCEDYRIVDSKGEPIIYPKSLFQVVDRSIPPRWHIREYDDGEYSLEPIALCQSGFYEDWFGSDGDYPAQRAARQLLRDELMRMAAASDEEDRQLIMETIKRVLP